MMDQAGAHMSDAYTQIQKKWSEQHNIDTCYAMAMNYIYRYVYTNRFVICNGHRLIK